MSFKILVHRACRRLRDLHEDDRGQSTTEYILILAVVVMVALKFKTAFSGRLDKIINNVGNQIDQATSDSSPQ